MVTTLHEVPKISTLFLHQMYGAKKLILSETASETCFTKKAVLF